MIWTLVEIMVTFNEETWRDICTSIIELNVILETFIDDIKTLFIKYRTFVYVIWAFIDKVRASNDETRRNICTSITEIIIRLRAFIDEI